MPLIKVVVFNLMLVKITDFYTVVRKYSLNAWKLIDIVGFVPYNYFYWFKTQMRVSKATNPHKSRKHNINIKITLIMLSYIEIKKIVQLVSQENPYLKEKKKLRLAGGSKLIRTHWLLSKMFSYLFQDCIAYWSLLSAVYCHVVLY